MDYVPEDFEDIYRDNHTALALVQGPATALLVTGIIDIALGLMNLGLQVFMVMVITNPGAFGGPGGPGGGSGPPPPSQALVLAPQIVMSLVGVILGVIIVAGSLKMKRLESHGFAIASCVLAMIPCFGCCLLGLPFGIWGIVVLNKPEVSSAFRSAPFRGGAE